MSNGFKNLTQMDRLELRDLEEYKRIDRSQLPLWFTPYISGIEVTQAIQYYHASRHLTDPADRGPDNSLGLAALKPAWVRVYVRSGFFNSGVTLSGKLIVERRSNISPVIWENAAEVTPRAPGSVTAASSVDYVIERTSVANTLNFILPASIVHGYLRLHAIIWPEGGNESSPSDTEEIYADATLLQTLRVRGIMVSYNGPNAAGTVTNMNLPAPTLADLQTTCGNTFTVYPVQSTGVFSSGGTIAWATPLTGVATSPGGCSQQWLDLNVDIAKAKANDGNRTDVLYVGLLPAGVPIANVGGCNSSGVSAVPNGQQWTMAHELGHAVGLAHGPCGTAGDANYPAYEPYDPANSPTASIGEYGLDINDGTIHAPGQKDFMSYCSPPWISLYHFSRLFNNSALDPRRNEAPRLPHIPELLDPWLWPWEYIPDPPSWELPSHFVKVSVQPVISLIGIVDLSGDVNVSSLMRVRANPRLRDVAATNMVAELIGANGQVVSRAAVMQTHAHGSGCACGGNGHGSPATGYAFHAMLADVEPGTEIRIIRIDPDGHEEKREVWSRKPSGGPPRVKGVEVRIDKRDATIRWEASVGDQTDFSIQFSKDQGTSWNGLVAGLREPKYRFTLADLPSGSIVFRVLAHNGFQTTYADAQPIKVRPRPPVISIVHPYDGRTYSAGLPLRLFAAVNTHLGAQNSKLKTEWQVDGETVGAGLDCWIDAPKAGKHECRLVARDDGGEAEVTIAFVTH
ncbi:MAG: hypothetical protein U0941_13155 [Planctomycetaceae bacterium]